MPRTTFQIEREARWRVWALFGLLVGIMLVCVVVVAVVIELFFRTVTSNGASSPASVGANLEPIALAVLVALLLAVVYWLVARIGARDRLIRMMHAMPLDPGDRFHQRLANIVEEMRLATGAPMVQCLTVPTVGMNAFTFSDLHGGACIGVTEGALARLSREQLQGVVAHEFGHVLSGDYVTATTACLLFGVYGGLADSLDEVGDDRQGVSLLAAVLRLLQAVSAVTNAALSRQREWVADAAAAHYTRDPLSLAQALQMMIRHPGGAGYIPDALSALCIRPTDLSPGTWVTRAMATHPPVNERIGALLKLAHVDRDQFQKQADAAETAFEQREHVTQAPDAEAVTPAADQLAQAVAAPLAAAAPAAAPLGAALGAVAPAPTAASGVLAATAGALPPTVTQPAALPPTVAQPAAAPPAAAAPGAAPPRTTAPPAAASSLHVNEAAEQAVRCPGCGAALERCDYEGATVLVCRSCGGRVVTSSQVQRILTRREMRFDDRQQRLADYVVEHGDELRRDIARRRAAHATLVACPRCGRTMLRRYFSYDEAVEIDYCTLCDLFWFEKDELEVLQAIAERQVQ